MASTPMPMAILAAGAGVGDVSEMHHGSSQTILNQRRASNREMLPVTHERSGDLEAAFSDGPAGGYAGQHPLDRDG
jgi:hypothetical protein